MRSTIYEVDYFNKKVKKEIMEIGNRDESYLDTLKRKKQRNEKELKNEVKEKLQMFEKCSIKANEDCKFENKKRKMNPPSNEVTLLLVGCAGNGKSATGNSIIGRRLFQTTASTSCCSSIPCVKRTTIEGQVVNVIDVPGLDTENSTAEDFALFKKLITMALDMCRFSFTALVVVLKYGKRFTKQETEVIEIIKDILGKNVVHNSGICVITHGDHFTADCEEEFHSFDDWRNDQEGEIQSLFQECENRCVLFNNRTQDPTLKSMQVFKLLHNISLVKYYSDYSACKDFDTLELETKAPKVLEDTREFIREKREQMKKIGSYKNLDVQHTLLIDIEKVQHSLLEKYGKSNSIKYPLLEINILLMDVKNKIKECHQNMICSTIETKSRASTSRDIETQTENIESEIRAFTSRDIETQTGNIETKIRASTSRDIETQTENIETEIRASTSMDIETQTENIETEIRASTSRNIETQTENIETEIRASTSRDIETQTENIETEIRAFTSRGIETQTGNIETEIRASTSRDIETQTENIETEIRASTSMDIETQTENIETEIRASTSRNIETQTENIESEIRAFTSRDSETQTENIETEIRAFTSRDIETKTENIETEIRASTSRDIETQTGNIETEIRASTSRDIETQTENIETEIRASTSMDIETQTENIETEIRASTLRNIETQTENIETEIRASTSRDIETQTENIETEIRAFTSRDIETQTGNIETEIRAFTSRDIETKTENIETEIQASTSRDIETQTENIETEIRAFTSRDIETKTENIETEIRASTSRDIETQSENIETEIRASTSRDIETQTENIEIEIRSFTSRVIETQTENIETEIRASTSRAIETQTENIETEIRAFTSRDIETQTENIETEIRASTSRAIETQTENTDEHKHEECDHCRQYSARHFWTNFNKDDEDSSLTDMKVKSMYPSYEDIEKPYVRFFYDSIAYIKSEISLRKYREADGEKGFERNLKDQFYRIWGEKKTIIHGSYLKDLKVEIQCFENQL
ncbi:hypothetical protein Btru_048202 [Bulinus truncatus]|nr:hypothetical protein Btru_048202 [Bulinus truncatus]